MRQDTLAALEKTGVKIPNIHNTIEKMSGGQRQCVAIARTASFHSKLTIMDEPTAALGVQETEQVENIIRQLKAQGEPLILVSHNMRQVFDLADRIVVFRRAGFAPIWISKAAIIPVRMWYLISQERKQAPNMRVPLEKVFQSRRSLLRTALDSRHDCGATRLLDDD